MICDKRKYEKIWNGNNGKLLRGLKLFFYETGLFSMFKNAFMSLTTK